MVIHHTFNVGQQVNLNYKDVIFFYLWIYEILKIAILGKLKDELSISTIKLIWIATFIYTVWICEILKIICVCCHLVEINLKKLKSSMQLSPIVANWCHQSWIMFLFTFLCIFTYQFQPYIIFDKGFLCLLI